MYQDIRGSLLNRRLQGKLRFGNCDFSDLFEFETLGDCSKFMLIRAQV
jgi:hypothetical protein